MKIQVDKDFIDSIIRDMAIQAVRNQRTFEYMIYWLKQPIGWQKKAKYYLKKALEKEIR